ncbi:Hypothetical predicted protein [Podarcis lilfordi]|uniref:Uncharacterized protein n=1 Tax=Podarcis lilfordi TaxID=74358 RepID=A0AA35L7Z1_9SAUR|nr:Hypothetical predicted protein [Podarcis lilfordi]
MCPELRRAPARIFRAMGRNLWTEIAASAALSAPKFNRLLLLKCNIERERDGETDVSSKLFKSTQKLTHVLCLFVFFKKSSYTSRICPEETVFNFFKSMFLDSRRSTEVSSLNFLLWQKLAFVH